MGRVSVRKLLYLEEGLLCICRQRRGFGLLQSFFHPVIHSLAARGCKSLQMDETLRRLELDVLCTTGLSKPVTYVVLQIVSTDYSMLSVKRKQDWSPSLDE